MKKLIAIFALAVISTSAFAGGGYNGWNGNGYRGGYYGYRGGCYNCGWAALGGFAVGALVGSAVAAPYAYATPAPYYYAPQPVYVSPPPVVYQSQTVVNIPAPTNELQARLANAYAAYANGSLTYQEYMQLRSNIIANYSQTPR